MNCPDCGASDQIAESYCRLCGEWLGKRGGQLAYKPEDKLTSMVVFSAMSAVFALTSAIVLMATYFGTDEAKWSIYMVNAFCLVIAVHQSVNFWYALEVKLRHRRARRGAVTPTIDRKTKELEPPPMAQPFEFRDIASVTEHTTDRLVVPTPARPMAALDADQNRER